MTHLQIGTIVSIKIFFYDHVGMVSGTTFDGQPTIIHNSWDNGKVVENTLGEFCKGKKYKIESIPDNRLKGHYMVQLAYSLIGKPYNLFTYNCEHFVAQIKDAELKSPQLSKWLTIASLVIGITSITLKLRR